MYDLELVWYESYHDNESKSSFDDCQSLTRYQQKHTLFIEIEKNHTIN